MSKKSNKAVNNAEKKLKDYANKVEGQKIKRCYF